MTNAVVFKTPTKLDMNAFQVFGVSSKPNTNNPIGYFGTGLKYAIAVLVNKDIDVSIFVDGVEYVFYKKEGTFRDKNYQQIMMKKRGGLLSKWSYTALPFTTQLGKNWELWQAFRELHSNTLDEKGMTFAVNLDVQPSKELFVSMTDHTFIVVKGDQFLDVYNKMDEIFLPNCHDSSMTWDGVLQVEIINQPSEYIYYRGLRVKDLDKQNRSLLTYNILSPIELTEDRTIKFDYYMHAKITSQLSSCTDPAICKIVASANIGTFEEKLNWEYAYGTLSDEMKYAINMYGKNNARISAYGSRFNITIPKNTWKDKLAKAIYEDNDEVILELIKDNKTQLLNLLLLS